MADKKTCIFLFLSFVLLFRCTEASDNEPEPSEVISTIKNGTDFPSAISNISVKILGKEDENTTIYKKYMAIRQEQQQVSALNVTESASLNGTNTTSLNETEKKPKWYCSGRDLSPEHSGKVLLVNDSALIKWVNSSSNSSDGCAVVMFYAQFCPFSASIAPQFNAFGRAYNNTPVLAIDAYKYSSMNARFGVVAVPTILIFHAGKPVLKFNHSKTLDDLRMFIKNYTGLEGNMTVNVTNEDHIGPVKSQIVLETDFYLILSSLFVIGFSLYVFSQTTYGENTWTRITRFVHWTKILDWFKPKQD